jgi:hypothetical protein
VLYAFLPRWIEWFGILGPCSLLRCRRGRAFYDGTGVEDRLERLCNPTESGVPSVVKSKGAEGHGELMDELVDEALSGRGFRFHLLGVIENYTKLYSLFGQNEQ